METTIFLNFATQTIERPAPPWSWWLGIVTAIIALAFALHFYRNMMSKSEGNDKMVEIAQAVREGAMAYLRQQYRVVTIAFGVLFVSWTSTQPRQHETNKGCIDTY